MTNESEGVEPDSDPDSNGSADGAPKNVHADAGGPSPDANGIGIGMGIGIGAIAHEIGLTKDTLRVWERRYGFPKPQRSLGGERLYPQEQVTKLRLVKRLLDAVPPGSYLVIAHPASDIHAAQVGTAANRLNQVMADPVTMRSHAQVARFFDGLELVQPGLVQVHRWRAVPADPDLELANYGGVARKPC